ncbi:MAG: dihydropteroate synthase [Thermoplasmata archaeon]|nr:MAG: dihydropteroate synthase [Thermoplasmata archaeon]
MVDIKAPDGSQLGDRPFVMGILNVTPDSFSDGGQFSGEGAIEHARRMVAEGADIIDIGGESTRPGSDPVPFEEEMARIEEVLPAVVDLGVPVSIDTTKASVAEWALDNGAVIVNDVSACRFDDEMAPLVAGRGCPLVLMHMLGMPKTMQEDPTYPRGVVQEITAFFQERLEAVAGSGVRMDQVILDPGIGFGKTVPHNLTILDRLVEFQELGQPIMVGASRKWFIGLVGGGEVGERLGGSIAAVVVAVLGGAEIVRVHDVAETVQAVRVAHSISNYNEWRGS